jgi:hypothetical protein
MKMDFDMERLYKMVPKSTLQTLRARLESGKSIFEIVHDFRFRHGLASANQINSRVALSQAG